jgi:hypothetical protein
VVRKAVPLSLIWLCIRRCPSANRFPLRGVPGQQDGAVCQPAVHSDAVRVRLPSVRLGMFSGIVFFAATPNAIVIG